MAEASAPQHDAPLANATWDTIVDGTNDVAMTKDLEKMMTEAAGRRPFQQVWLWTTSEVNHTDVEGPSYLKKATTRAFDPTNDGPVIAGACPLLPVNEELLEHNNAKPYLEVGIVLGEEPKKYMHTGLSRDKQRAIERQKRGVLRRDDHAMRVFIPISEYIQKQAKFYVGCHFQGGRLFPRLIETHTVDTKKPSKERLAELTKVCKIRAAVNKTAAVRPTASITTTDVVQKLASDPLVVNKSEVFVPTLVLQVSLLKRTQNQLYWKAMMDALEKCSPDLKYGPHTSTEGIAAFMNFTSELTNDLALLLIQEMKTADPLIQTLNPRVITRVHGVLCQLSRAYVQILHLRCLGFFLRLCHRTVVEGSPTFYVTKEVTEALQITKMHHEYLPSSEIWTAPISEDKSDAQLSQEDFLTVLSEARHYVEAIDRRARGDLDDVVKQHGVLLMHVSMDELLSKLSSTVDVAALNSLLEQLGALHAGLFAVQNCQTTDRLRELIHYLDTIIVTTQTSS